MTLHWNPALRRLIRGALVPMVGLTALQVIYNGFDFVRVAFGDIAALAAAALALLAFYLLTSIHSLVRSKANGWHAVDLWRSCGGCSRLVLASSGWRQVHRPFTVDSLWRAGINSCGIPASLRFR